MSSVSHGSKELLPLGGKPVLERVLEEAAGAPLDEFVVVTSPSKHDVNRFLESRPHVRTVVQDKATGLAPALILASGTQPVLLLLPDTIFYPESPSGRLAQAIERGYDLAIAVEPVSEERVSQYGIVEWSRESGRISRIIEKPTPDQTTSRWAIAARFALSARTIHYVSQRVRERSGQGHEIDLPPILNEAILAGHTGVAIALEQSERRFDCGSPTGYRLACEAIDASL